MLRTKNPHSTFHIPHSADVLFEIGTEELPAAYLTGVVNQISKEAVQLLESYDVTGEIGRGVRFIKHGHALPEVFVTPRRLVLHIKSLPGVIRKPAEEIRGPSKQAAFDANGKPTAALTGFLKSRGGNIPQIKEVLTEKGVYLYLQKPGAQIPTEKILPGFVRGLVSRLRFPKTMRWDDSGIRFARPIRWLLALYGSTPIRCTVGNLASAPKTWVGGPLRPQPKAVRSVQVYFQILKEALIILDQEKRRTEIERHVAMKARQFNAETAPETISHGLLDEVTYLVERPDSLRGRFDSKYLQLPREVLLASMAKYQRLFSIEGSGKLIPQFVAILEGPPGKPAAVCKVIERILDARLADSLMFWEEDRKRLPLDRMARALTGVTFHEQLGSMADKSNRLCELSPVLKDAWGLSPEEYKHLQRACELAKADLVSSMVKEFPTLQGVVGKYYAKASKEPRAVAEAIEEHYLPIGDRLPKTLLGSALAILDKFDTLASYCSIGIMPTGDQDPFGLRRAAQGIVEVAWKVHRPLPINQLWQLWTHATASLSEKTDKYNIRGKLYLDQRLYTFAWPAPAPSPDFIDAVLASNSSDDLVDAMDRIQTLQRLAGDPGLLKAAKVIERTGNILRKTGSETVLNLTKGVRPRTPYMSEVDPSLLTEATERTLWDLYSSKKDDVERLTQQKSYAEATRLFGDVFYQPLHDFFDQVMVNVPDETLRQNRLALMQAINTLYTDRIADLSKLTVLQHHQREESPA